MPARKQLHCLIAILLFQTSCLALISAGEASASGVGVLARIHFTIQTSNFDRARNFYRQLGYTQGISNYPKTNTHLMARSLRMYELCAYELESIEVMSIPNAIGPTSIDLIKFAIPYNATGTQVSALFSCVIPMACI